MAQYKLIATIDGERIDQIRKKLQGVFQADAVWSVNKIEQKKSRADRCQEAVAMIEDGKTLLEELKDELETWKDNLPDNLQDGETAQSLDEAVSSLEDAISQAEEAAENAGGVEFPSAYGG